MELENLNQAPEDLFKLPNQSIPTRYTLGDIADKVAKLAVEKIIYYIVVVFLAGCIWGATAYVFLK